MLLPVPERVESDVNGEGKRCRCQKEVAELDAMPGGVLGVLGILGALRNKVHH